MKKVLLVDDDLNAREVLRLVLESQQLECIEVGNGSEAIAWLSTQQADLDYLRQPNAGTDRAGFY